MSTKYSLSTAEVSVFNHEHPLRMVLNNIASHALMFHWRGGTFARDNYPGLPMMDPLSGLLLVSGLVILVRKADTFRRFMACTIVLNFLSGIFSASQECAPYIYRTAAVIVPAILAAGAGLEWFVEKAGARKILILAAPIVALPALVVKLPQEVRQIIGDLSDTEKVLIGLALQEVV